MRRGVARVFFSTAVAAFVFGPLAAADARVPAVLPTPCVPTESTLGGKTAFTFSAPAECTFTPPTDLNGATYTIFAVGGGGGGGAHGGGGGGGGEARQLVGHTAVLNSKFVILVGAGGTGGIRTVTGASNNPAAGQSSSVWTVDPAATSRSTSPLVEAKGGGVGGSYNSPGSGGSAGTGGSGGTRLATGQGGMSPMSTSPSGTPGVDGAQWSVSGAYYGGGGGGGICANGGLTPSMMDPASGGRDGGGAGAGKRPAPLNFSSDGSDALPGSGSGGGGGAGCTNAFAGGAPSANGGTGGRGTVILVVTARASATTTLAPTSGIVVTTTIAAPRTATTLAASTSQTTLAGTVTVPKFTTTTVKSTTGTLKSTATTLAGAVTPTTAATATATTLPAASTGTTAGNSLSGTATTLPSTTQDTSATAAAPAAPELLPTRPVFFGGIKTAAEYFGIEFGAAVGRPVRGASIRGTASDLQPGSTVRAVLRSDPIVLGEFTVGTDGTVAFDIVLPDDIPEGDHSLTFEAVSAEGVPVSSVTVFSVDPAGNAETVVAAAETVGAPVEQAVVERSAAAEVPVYDTERHVGRTAAIAATAVVITSLAGLAVTQATGGLGMSFQAPGGGMPGAPSPTAPSSAPSGPDSPRTVAQRREEEYGLAPEDLEPGLDGDDEEEEAEISGTEANLLEHTEGTEPGRGDRSGLWRLPGYPAVDRFLRGAVPAVSSWSILGTRVLQDGHWLRAMTGIVAPLLWAVGFVLGAGAALGLPGLVTAPDPAVVSAVVALSLLDAMTGASAWLGFTLVALVTGNVTSVFDARTLLGLGVLFVALPSIGSRIRPFTRAADRRDGATMLDRAGDYVIMPALLAYAASTAYSALNGLSGLEMVPADRANALLVVVLAAAYVRLLGEDAARVWFPLRSATVRVPVDSLPRPAARLGTVAIGAGLYLLAAAPFFGLGWRTWLMVGLVTLVPVLGLAEERFPNIAVVHRFFPRGLLRFVVMMFLTAWFGRFVLSLADNPVDARPVAVFMLLPGVLVGLVDLVGREGGEWRDSNAKRLAGLALWVVAIAVLSGRITV